MIRLDAATVLLQWSVGGLFFLWWTTRRHEIGAGYGWLLRGSFLVLAAGAAAAGFATTVVPVREASAIVVAVVSLLTLRRKNPSWDLVAPLLGVVGLVAAAVDAANGTADTALSLARVLVGAAFLGAVSDAMLLGAWDLVAPLLGIVGLVAAAVDAANGTADTALSLARVLVGAAFLGAVSDAMLLGHWYLVQPGLPRGILGEVVTALRWITPFEIAVMLLPTGMFSVFSGAIDDGWGGMLGWFWIACAVTTVVLTEVTRAAMKERSYSAVMAATGLLYLSILTAFGTDLVARAVLA